MSFRPALFRTVKKIEGERGQDPRDARLKLTYVWDGLPKQTKKMCNDSRIDEGSMIR